MACLMAIFALESLLFPSSPSYTWPSFVSQHRGFNSCTKWGIKDHQYPNTLSCNLFGVMGTGNAWTLSMTALAKTLVLLDQTAPRNLSD